MFSNFDFDVIRRSLGYLFFDGMTFTLTLTALSAVGGLVLGTLLALMRLSGFKLLGRIAGLYVDLMRSLPLVLVIFWFYFLVPYIGQWVTGASRPIRVGAFASSLVTFIMFEAAYFSEIMRAGIQSISKGQPAAAQRARPDLQPDHALHRAAAGVPEHAAGAADADHRAVPGHLAGLRAVDLRISSAPRARWRSATGGWSKCTCSRPSVYFVISCFASYGVRRLQARIAIVH